MKIAIICAMVEEMNSIIAAIGSECIISKHGNFEIRSTKYHNHDLAFILCGIGKVNAALHTQFMLDKFTPDYVINVGVAGGLIPELTFGDVVVASDLVEHDVDVCAFGMPPGQIPRMDVFAFNGSQALIRLMEEITPLDFKVQLGRIASGDQFIDDSLQAQKIHSTFGAIACEMEGAAVAHVCHVNNVEFLVVRALSDTAGSDNKAATRSYEQLKNMVAERSSLIVKQLLSKI